MNHDPLEAAMFWVGALFVLTPMVFAGVLLFALRRQLKRRAKDQASGVRAEPGVGAKQRDPERQYS